MGLLSNENAISASGYQISNSLRFQAASSQYLARTPASTGSRQTFTYSFWTKRGTLGTLQRFIAASDNATGDFIIDWTTSNTLEIYDNGPANVSLITTQVFRDPSAWYHIVITYDTTNATTANRVRIYVNGTQVTAFGTATYPAQNTNSFNNQASIPARIGIWPSGSQYFDGYMAEVNFIDGQALTPSSFGSTDATSGQWVAAKYTGTYGTNGFYLPFSNGTSTTTLGADSSGNGNNWTLTNFTRSAGVSDCWMTDVPSGNGGAGTQPNSNYCVINPLNYINGSAPSKANLYTASGGSGVETRAGGTLGVTSGKWYFETTIGGTYCNAQIGVHDALSALSTTTMYRTFLTLTGQKNDGSTSSSYGSTASAGSVIGCAIDMDSGKIWWSINNTWQASGDPAAGTNAAFTNLSGTVIPFFTTYNNGSGTTTHDYNGGQRSFAYTPPTGFKALCTANLPVATIKQGNKYMDATLYTGNGTGQSVTNAGSFKPDLVWAKSRSSGAQWNILVDSSRGAGTVLFSNSTAADQSYPTSITSFNSNGFTVGVDATGGWNVSGSSMVGWQWQAGQGSTSSNTSGSITSTTSVNATAGFSIVTYTGTGANATVGHGLGVAPKMYIVKNRNQVGDWCVYHVNMNATPQNYYMQLNLTSAAGANSTIWNNTAPTSTTFSIGSYLYGNGVQYIAYCFAEIAGFSKFGSYTGNGSADGTFVYTGFRPKFVMIKNSSSVTDWNILDTTRNTYNVAGSTLQPDNSGAEQNGWNIDILSNGFKVRTTLNDLNGSGNTIIFAAFAESPFASSNAR